MACGLMYRGAPRARSSRVSNPEEQKPTTRWRVCASHAIPVSSDVDESKAEIICDLEPRTMCDVSAQETLTDGTVRFQIVDPVWRGWVTCKKGGWGVSMLEPLDAPTEASARIAKSNEVEVSSPVPPVELLSLDKLQDLQAELMADDIAIEIDEMSLWTEHEVREFFESGGANRPPRRLPPPSREQDGATAAFAHGETAANSTVVVEEKEVEPKPMSERERAARDAGQWKKGMMVLLRGLSADEWRDFNGRSGVVSSWDTERGRYDVRLANRVVRVRPPCLDVHPLQKQRDANDANRGDEVVFLDDDAKAARAGTYAVKLDPQFWYDQALERVFNASNEFEVLELPAQFTDDFTRIRKQYRKVSLSVHPDKNKHPQADAAFRKVYGAFETLSDPVQQRRLLFELGFNLAASEAEKEAWAKAGAEDDDDVMFQWWWEATVPDVEKAAEEAEGAEMDLYAAQWVSDGLGGNVDDIRWVGIKKAQGLHEAGRAIFIDCRERHDHGGGTIPGAHHVPMSAVMRYGIVNVLGNELIHLILSTKRHALIIIYSNVATPFSRCRAFARWMLRAGHSTLPAARFRRLRGGIFGWEKRGGKVALAIGNGRGYSNSDLEDRLKVAEMPKDLETVDID